MRNPRKSSIAVAGLFALAAWTSTATAGHTNVVLETQLNGREEVAADGSNAMVGDPNARAEAYVFGVDGDPTTLCYLIVGVKKLAETEMTPGAPRAAHIHFGERGTNGPVVANLAWPQGGQAGDCLTEGETGKFPNANFQSGVVQQILLNPASFYINVHNSAYPSGAIRGQLNH